MSKIMCDVCGTVFQDTAACCPICGWTPEGKEPKPQAPQNADYDLGEDEELPEPLTRRKIIGFGHIPQPQNPDEEPEQQPENRGFNSPMVIGLVVVIVFLLLGMGVLFFGFLLPGKNAEKAAATTAATEAPTAETITEAPTIPCTGLVLTSGKAELVEHGQNFLIHLQLMPEDTTDVVTYKSENEEVATVSDSGKITAVGEGDTAIVIVCGSQMIRSNVSVHYQPEESTTVETTAATEETSESTESSEATEATEEAKATEATTEATTEAATEATTSETTQTTAAATESTAPLKDVTLKLKRTDMKFEGAKRGMYTTLELDCDLTPEEVQWMTSNEAVAKVDNGKIYAMGNGTAFITVKYGEQEVKCTVRVLKLK